MNVKASPHDELERVLIERFEGTQLLTFEV
jgi:hypothetical protein